MNVFYSTIKVPILIWLKKLIILTNEQCKKQMIVDTRNFLARTFYSFVAYIVYSLQFLLWFCALLFTTQNLLALG